MQINDENIKVTVYLKPGCGRLLANANVSLRTVEFGWVTVFDSQIWRSPRFNSRLGEDINITFPQVRVKGQWFSKAKIEDEEMWYLVEERIYSAYNLKVRSSHDETSHNNS